jgi:hypothetical protein
MTIEYTIQDFYEMYANRLNSDAIEIFVKQVNDWGLNLYEIMHEVDESFDFHSEIPMESYFCIMMIERKKQLKNYIEEAEEQIELMIRDTENDEGSNQNEKDATKQRYEKIKIIIQKLKARIKETGGDYDYQPEQYGFKDKDIQNLSLRHLIGGECIIFDIEKGFVTVNN